MKFRKIMSLLLSAATAFSAAAMLTVTAEAAETYTAPVLYSSKITANKETGIYNIYGAGCSYFPTTGYIWKEGSTLKQVTINDNVTTDLAFLAIATNNEGASLVVDKANSNLTVNGNQITTSIFNGQPAASLKTGILKIQKCALNGINGGNGIDVAGGSFDLNASDVTGNMGISVTGGTATINPNAVTGTTNAVSVTGGSITINGGTFNGGMTISNGGAMTINKGEFNGAIVNNGGTLTINGGSFESVPNSYTAPEGKTLLLNDSTKRYELADKPVEPDVPIAEVNGTQYTSFEEAYNAAIKDSADATTISICGDTSVKDFYDKTLPQNKELTIDLCGHNLKMYLGKVAFRKIFEIGNNSVLKITDSSQNAGKLIVTPAEDYSASSIGFQINNGGKLVNDRAAIEAQKCIGKNKGLETLIVTAGTGCFEMASGSVTVPADWTNNVFSLEDKTSSRITGGTFLCSDGTVCDINTYLDQANYEQNENGEVVPTAKATYQYRWMGQIQWELENSNAVTSSVPTGSYAEGQKITLALIKGMVPKGYTFKGWKINNKIVSTEETFTFTMPAEPVTATVEFSIDRVPATGTPEITQNIESVDGVYTINNEADLRAIAELSKTESFSGKTIVLANDITMSDYNFLPIGQSVAFCGTFDGNGHKISKLLCYYEDGTECVGLFGKIGAGAAVNNLIIDDAEIYSTGSFGAAIAAQASGGAAITGCTVQNSRVRANSFVGSIVGNSESSNITDCVVDGNIIEGIKNGSACGNTYAMKATNVTVRNMSGYSFAGCGYGDSTSITATNCKIYDEKNTSELLQQGSGAFTIQGKDTHMEVAGINAGSATTITGGQFTCDVMDYIPAGTARMKTTNETGEATYTVLSEGMKAESNSETIVKSTDEAANYDYMKSDIKNVPTAITGGTPFITGSIKIGSKTATFSGTADMEIAAGNIMYNIIVTDVPVGDDVTITID